MEGIVPSDPREAERERERKNHAIERDNTGAQLSLLGLPEVLLHVYLALLRQDLGKGLDREPVMSGGGFVFVVSSCILDAGSPVCRTGLCGSLHLQPALEKYLPLSPQSEAIVIYTGWDRHALVGSEVRLYCSFFSWRWTSEDVTFSWSYRPDGSRDSISIFHYTGGMPYVDNKGPFRDRLEFIGNPRRRDGSILIRNLDYSDNGTFTCDAKNPPDIVGRPSNVRLLVYDKVPVRAGVITGAIIGSVLGLLILVVAIYYLMRFLVARRVFNLSVSKLEKGKKGKGKEGSQQRQPRDSLKSQTIGPTRSGFFVPFRAGKDAGWELRVVRKGSKCSDSPALLLTPDLPQPVPHHPISFLTEFVSLGTDETLSLSSPLIADVWGALWLPLDYPADVALDPDTAHCELIISGSGKVLRRGNWRVVSDNPKRFNHWSAVVSKEGFSSGRHYWEVKVNDHWTIGITRESALSKGAFSLTPREGYWILQCDPSHLVVHTDPEIHLPPHLLPRRLGLCLDVEEKQVSFYRVETRAHIYTFSDLEFREGEKLFPFFRTLDNANVLTILSPADCRK
ncbi:MYP0 protein, partial [Atractosteus spatula]|nr:MYP0 protein [Atractosteus spatula]